MSEGSDPFDHTKRQERQIKEMEKDRQNFQRSQRKELNNVINNYLTALRDCFDSKESLINYLKKDTPFGKNIFIYHGPEVGFNDWALMYNEDSSENKDSLVIDRLIFQKESFKNLGHLETILDKYVNELRFIKKAGNQLEKEVDIDGSKENILIFSDVNKLCIKMFIPIKTSDFAQYLL